MLDDALDDAGVSGDIRSKLLRVTFLVVAVGNPDREVALAIGDAVSSSAENTLTGNA